MTTRLSVSIGIGLIWFIFFAWFHPDTFWAAESALVGLFVYLKWEKWTEQSRVGALRREWRAKSYDETKHLPTLQEVEF